MAAIKREGALMVIAGDSENRKQLMRTPDGMGLSSVTHSHVERLL